MLIFLHFYKALSVYTRGILCKLFNIIFWFKFSRVRSLRFITKFDFAIPGHFG